MSEVNNNVNTYEDEIDLRELIMTLWRGKYIILSIALIAAILTGLYSMFMLPPVYQTRLDIVVNMPEQYRTRYGDYKLPITSNEQYIDLITSNRVLLNTIKNLGANGKSISVEGLRNRISIKKGSDPSKQNTFAVLVSANNPQESLLIAQNLFDNYIEFVDIMVRDRAVEYYYNQFSTDLLISENSLKSKQELLKLNKELLAETPRIINQKEAMQEAQENLVGSIDYIVLENIINPNYVEIEKNIIMLQQEIFVIEDTIRQNEEYLEQLEEEKQLIERYYDTGDNGEQDTPSLIGVVRSSIYLPSQPVAPSSKTGPNIVRNVAIGLIIGLMLGLFAAYVKGFWFKKEK
ncbi:MAG TPA: hypothetical protein GXZ37_08355 [Clostridiales bacterium]|jgi:capsular polysaccharide biosynthesis protein|nr:hypothetical protein [Clostridiales bacterium]